MTLILLLKLKLALGKTTPMDCRCTPPQNQQRIQVLILTPTRELAIQVADELNSLKALKMFGAIYGGQSISIQIKALKSQSLSLLVLRVELLITCNRNVSISTLTRIV